LPGQLVFALAEAADGKGFAAVEMVLPAEFHGKDDLAFGGEDGFHKVRLYLTFGKSRRRTLRSRGGVQGLRDSGVKRGFQSAAFLHDLTPHPLCFWL
jgi:hypothetical protein